jgi:LPS-assembly lipoprotein
MTRRGLLLVVAALVPLLSGCGNGGLQPLYGPSWTGSNTAEELAAVEISPIPGRVGQFIRNELIFKTTGGRAAPAPKYRLDVAIRESGQALLVKIDGENRGTLYAIDADFKLYRLSDNAVVLDGQASSRAAFQRDPSIFANVRARRDAEDRAARTLADELRTRLAAYLATAG